MPFRNFHFRILQHLTVVQQPIDSLVSVITGMLLLSAVFVIDIVKLIGSSVKCYSYKDVPQEWTESLEKLCYKSGMYFQWKPNSNPPREVPENGAERIDYYFLSTFYLLYVACINLIIPYAWNDLQNIRGISLNQFTKHILELKATMPADRLESMSHLAQFFHYTMHQRQSLWFWGFTRPGIWLVVLIICATCCMIQTVFKLLRHSHIKKLLGYLVDLRTARDKRRFKKFVRDFLLDDGSLALYLLEEVDEETVEQLAGFLYLSFLNKHAP
ncbi:hypothetical protein GCK72_022070 [Caenorhabditis remanei]|uniref:Innexin n=1 Tax=Caenorhabditis remanei TaxID=31234 RepID=A0A6A5FSU5_CAERE|nr:hypothetical protein GCK72_022070 [Caenorhabditis remanei]KAF1745623.1 hypothetical protein GCK72_022070 [Caenorhabditis remanei]